MPVYKSVSSKKKLNELKLIHTIIWFFYVLIFIYIFIALIMDEISILLWFCNAVIIAHPPNIMAFGISGTEFNTRTIPESYVVLRDIKVFPYGTQFLNIDKVSAVLGPKNPVIIFENDCVITCGRDLLQAYDRLEVAEFSAKSLIASKSISDLSSITENQIQEINKAFSI